MYTLVLTAFVGACLAIATYSYFLNFLTTIFLVSEFNNFYFLSSLVIMGLGNTCQHGCADPHRLLNPNKPASHAQHSVDANKLNVTEVIHRLVQLLQEKEKAGLSDAEQKELEQLKQAILACLSEAQPHPAAQSYLPSSSICSPSSGPSASCSQRTASLNSSRASCPAPVASATAPSVVPSPSSLSSPSAGGSGTSSTSTTTSSTSTGSMGAASSTLSVDALAKFIGCLSESEKYALAIKLGVDTSLLASLGSGASTGAGSVSTPSASPPLPGAIPPPPPPFGLLKEVKKLTPIEVQFNQMMHGNQDRQIPGYVEIYKIDPIKRLAPDLIKDLVSWLAQRIVESNKDRIFKNTRCAGGEFVLNFIQNLGFILRQKGKYELHTVIGNGDTSALTNKISEANLENALYLTDLQASLLRFKDFKFMFYSWLECLTIQNWFEVSRRKSQFLIDFFNQGQFESERYRYFPFNLHNKNGNWGGIDFNNLKESIKRYDTHDKNKKAPIVIKSGNNNQGLFLEELKKRFSEFLKKSTT